MCVPNQTIGMLVCCASHIPCILYYRHSILYGRTYTIHDMASLAGPRLYSDEVHPMNENDALALVYDDEHHYFQFGVKSPWANITDAPPPLPSQPAHCVSTIFCIGMSYATHRSSKTSVCKPKLLTAEVEMQQTTFHELEVGLWAFIPESICNKVFKNGHLQHDSGNGSGIRYATYRLFHTNIESGSVLEIWQREKMCNIPFQVSWCAFESLTRTAQEFDMKERYATKFSSEEKQRLFLFGWKWLRTAARNKNIFWQRVPVIAGRRFVLTAGTTCNMLVARWVDDGKFVHSYDFDSGSHMQSNSCTVCCMSMRLK
jgi:hypothetical protein